MYLINHFDKERMAFVSGQLKINAKTCCQRKPDITPQFLENGKNLRMTFHMPNGYQTNLLPA